MDGHEDPSLCAMDQMLTAINEIPAISQKSIYDLALLHAVWNKEKQPTNNTKEPPSLKTGHTLSSRQEIIQRKQARKTITIREYFLCSKGQHAKYIFLNFLFGIVIGKMFGKGSEMKIASKHCIWKMFRTSRRQHTDDWKSRLKILTSCCRYSPNTTACRSPRLQPPL